MRLVLLQGVRSRRGAALAALVAMAACAFTRPVFASPTFQGIGDMPGGGTIYGSTVTGLSADGSVVVGWGDRAYGTRGAFLWTPAGGMVELGDLPGGNYDSDATGVSGDGTVAVGFGEVATGAVKEAFRWTAAGGLEGLGVLSGYGSSRALAISADGGTIVGFDGGSTGYEPFRWTAGTGMVGLGSLPGSSYSQATGVSADGSVVVGGDNGAAGAFRWTAGTGMVGLGTLPGTDSSKATAVSDDGSVVVGGTVTGSFSSDGFLWQQGAGMVSLGFQYPMDVSGDGGLVVGQLLTGSGASAQRTAMIWDEHHGARDLAVVLESLGVGLGGWTLTSAAAVSEIGRISADGSPTLTTLAGTGINPNGDTEGWIATVTTSWLVPEPSTGLLLASALGWLLAAERRR